MTCADVRVCVLGLTPRSPQAESVVLPLIPVVLHAGTIGLLNAIFRRVGEALTSFENHRTEGAYKQSLLLKRFAFEACDCYLALFYIAFELQDVPKLRKELIALFTVDTVRRVLLETIVPLLLNRRVVSRAHASRARPTEAEGRGGAATAAPAAPAAPAEAARAASAEMALEEYDDFDDYLEMVIQYGYILLFASAFPLAAAISLLANAAELLADAFKLAVLCRRPRPVRAASIGGWGVCLYALTLASIFTNLFITGIASDQMATLLPTLFRVPPAAAAKGWFATLLPHRPLGTSSASAGEHEMRAGMGRYVVLTIVAIEHALLLLLLLAEAVVARPPAWVRLVLARREHAARMGMRSVLSQVLPPQVVAAAPPGATDK